MTSFVGYNETSILSIDPLKTLYCIRARAKVFSINSSTAHAAVPGGDYSGKPAPGTTLGALLKSV
jgi:hypothetical protein